MFRGPKQSSYEDDCELIEEPQRGTYVSLE